jgi:hypothetical protein
VASAAATGAVLSTDLPPRHARLLLDRGAIVGGLMYFLFDTSKIAAARDAKLVSENAANRRIEQKPSAIKAIGRS